MHSFQLRVNHNVSDSAIFTRHHPSFGNYNMNNIHLKAISWGILCYLNNIESQFEGYLGSKSRSQGEKHDQDCHVPRW